VSRSASHLYGGVVRKYRIRSENGAIQYQFVASPTHVWINPPQTLTTELTTYGLRTLDVHAPEELCVPGYEYHFMDESPRPPDAALPDPARLRGRDERGGHDPGRHLGLNEALPVVREFRRRFRRADGVGPGGVSRGAAGCQKSPCVIGSLSKRPWATFR
jgi:hypothetical protein